jgi:hypothetical protein
MRESSTVAEMRGSSTVAEMWGSSTVRQMRESSTVAEMWGSSTVAEMWGSSTVAALYADAMVSAYGTNKITCHGYNIVKTSDSNQKNLTLVMSKNSHLIVIPDFKGTWEDYTNRYPVEVKRGKAIMYKAVHKIKGKYIADYDRKTEYVVGKTHTKDTAPREHGSCSYGLHVAHKSWARAFGSSWDDIALLECEVPVKSIVVADDCDGKVRTSTLKVLREVPESEWYA